MDKKLYRDENHKVIGGVCAGLADYFGIDVSIVRLVFLLTLILKGGGLLIYVIFWIVLPKKPFLITPPFGQPGHQPFGQPYNQPFVDYTVPPANPIKTDPDFVNLPKKRSTGSIIAGCILVLLGAAFILNDLNIIPDWDFEHLWPVILIAVGVIVIFTGSKKQPWEQADWHKQDSSTNDNPPTL
jgi:phage shock protein C